MAKAKKPSSSKKPKSRRGLVVGKFYPPHNGHSYLIETALERASEVDVLVCDHPDHAIPATRRAAWLQKLHPAANVQIIFDIGKDDDSEAWARHTTEFLGYTPDTVFSSEDYGETYASFLGADHHMVDKQRVRVPTSARRIRPDVLAHWDFLHPLVRADYAVRVCVLGAESTGTTTLSRELAEHYNTLWVPEYGRLYSEALATTDHEWCSDEFTHIARMQQTMEQQLAGQSNGLLVCDTNAFATRLWHERYLGGMYPPVDDIANTDKVNLYIITDVDIPFEDDGLRDGEHIRHAMHERFVSEVAGSGVPFLIVSGSVLARLQTAIKIIDRLLSKKVTI